MIFSTASSPLCVNRKFSGFRSRCTMLWVWQWSTARSTVLICTHPRAATVWVDVSGTTLQTTHFPHATYQHSRRLFVELLLLLYTLEQFTPTTQLHDLPVNEHPTRARV